MTWTKSPLLFEFSSGTLPARLTRRLNEARRRSASEYGLEPGSIAQENVLPANGLAELKEREERFLRIANPGLYWLHRRISSLGYCTMLTDKSGTTLEQRASDHLKSSFVGNGLRLGSCWSEVEQGACGIGTAIVDRAPILIHESEHFLIRNHGISCSAAPLFGPEEELLGVLNTTAITELAGTRAQMLAYNLTLQAATQIEYAYFFDVYSNAWVMQLGNEPNFSGSALLIAFDEDGRVLGMNRQARHHLEEHLIGGKLNIEELLDTTAERLIRYAYSFPGQPIKLQGGSKRDLAAYLRAPCKLPQTRPRRQSCVADFGNMAVGDPNLIESINRLKRIANNKIPILLMGETGSGKESFAKAIHDYSERRDKPFIAINCAAIPETLIESELFGYKEGAFTGAKAKGCLGKIAMANGGTLFLDEIGDMPLLLQTRLLRVLAEGEVLALGATTPDTVDISVICATHRNLAEMVAHKAFREDLFYRLNAATFKLPPLRERADFAAVVHKVFAEEAARIDSSPMLSKQVEAILAQYNWPGNIRELRNVLRFAIAVCTGDEVQAEHLPDSIRYRHDFKPIGHAAATVPMAVRQEKELSYTDITGAIVRAKGNKSFACKLLGISRATLYRKLEQFSNDAGNPRAELH